VLTAKTVAARPEFSIQAWACRPHCAGWSPVERPTDARLVLVRAGRFRRRGSGGTVDLDRTIGYLGEPGEEEQFAHPRGGDACTSVQLSPASWRQLVGEPGRMRVDESTSTPEPSSPTAGCWPPGGPISTIGSPRSWFGCSPPHP
jgi:hypothetical protein